MFSVSRDQGIRPQFIWNVVPTLRLRIQCLHNGLKSLCSYDKVFLTSIDDPSQFTQVFGMEQRLWKLSVRLSYERRNQYRRTHNKRSSSALTKNHDRIFAPIFTPTVFKNTHSKTENSRTIFGRLTFMYICSHTLAIFQGKKVSK